MKLCIEPHVPLTASGEDLQLVVCVDAEGLPEIFTDPGQPKPDRHLLLGIVQSVTVAVEEKDKDLVAFCGCKAINLDIDGQSKDLACSLLIFRSVDGRIGAVAPEDAPLARSLARKALRWFTGTIRLDVP